METNSKSLYLDLMKKTLMFILWEEPNVPIETYNYNRPLRGRIATHILTRIFGAFNYKIVKSVEHSLDVRLGGMMFPVYAHTMIGLKRLDNIEHCVIDVIENNIEGHLIETGVWRGGACIFMRAILAAYGVTDRKVFVADSFEGLPKPDSTLYPQDAGADYYKHEILSVSKEEVEANFEKYGLLDDQVAFLKGWFKDTLPSAPIEKVAVMRLDGDMYASTMDALVNLYHKLSIGGYCIIDDYGLDTCKQAVDDFRAERKITSPLIEIDWTGVYWRKE